MSTDVPAKAAAAGEGTREGSGSTVRGPEMAISGPGIDKEVVSVCDEGNKMELMSQVRPPTGSHKIPVRSLDEPTDKAGALTGMGILAAGAGAL